MFHKCAIVTGLFVVLFSLLPVRMAPGQDPPAETDPVLAELDEKIKQFLEGVSGGQTQSAYDDLLVRSQLLKQKDALKGLIEKTNELEKEYGPYRRFEQILAKRVGSDLVLLRYLYKCENFPVVWYFTFYRTPSETLPENGAWRVVTVRFDTELELLAF